MQYKAIKHASDDIVKILSGGVLVWRRINPGMSPRLKQELKDVAIECNGGLYYDSLTEYYDYIHSFYIRANKNIVNVRLYSSNTRVIDQFGNIAGRGRCTLTVSISLKVPDPNYQINYADKRFSIEIN